MDVLSMSAREILRLKDLAKLAKEASESSSLIAKNFEKAFSIGNRKIHVYHTESCGEYFGDGYLTIDGVFEYIDNWWGGRSYEFRCDTEGIYKMLRSSYLRTKGLADEDPEDFDCEIDGISQYFREFVRELKSK